MLGLMSDELTYFYGDKGKKKKVNEIFFSLRYVRACTMEFR